MNDLKDGIIAQKCGTVTINIYRTENNSTLFYIESSNKNVLNICDIIEDTLKLY